MSGGSFNYLHAQDWPDVRVSNLEDMLAELEHIAPGHPATARTRELLAEPLELEHDDAVGGPLRTVWHHVEWWRSGDYGEQQARDALDAYVVAVAPVPPCGDAYSPDLVCDAEGAHEVTFNDVTTWHRCGAVRWAR